MRPISRRRTAVAASAPLTASTTAAGAAGVAVPDPAAAEALGRGLAKPAALPRLPRRKKCNGHLLHQGLPSAASRSVSAGSWRRVVRGSSCSTRRVVAAAVARHAASSSEGVGGPVAAVTARDRRRWV
eukprot:scaffold11547_cov108-Isochrysis_galbana.AAC.4